MKPQHTRPFNAEHARAGAPYCQIDGDAAKVIAWDIASDNYPLAVRLSCQGDGETVAQFSLDGRPLFAAYVASATLVMTPLGTVDGKPVFVGDELEMNLANGWKRVAAEPTWAGTWTDDGKYVRWPAPAKVYPTTALSGPAMYSIYSDAKNVTVSMGLLDIANAALRHAIDARQVVTHQEHEDALIALGKSMFHSSADRATRDAAIAKAVRRACYVAGQNAIGNLDLAAIISKVQ